MKTVYQLMHRRGQGDVGAYSDVALFDSATAAAAATAVPDIRDWELRADRKVTFAVRGDDRWLIAEEQRAENDTERVVLALELIFQYGQIDGEHHKAWVIDQTVRILAGDNYDTEIADYREGGEYSWDEGVAP